MKFLFSYPFSDIEKGGTPKDSPLHVIAKNQNLI